MQPNPESSHQHRVRNLDQRLDDTGWALLLIMVGIVWLIPAGSLPEGSWLIGVGAILLAMNIVRRANGIKTSGLSLVLGGLALFAGLGAAFAMKLPFFAILFIVVGVSILIKQMFEKAAN